MREIKFRAWNKKADNWWCGSLGDVLNLGSLADVVGEHFEFDPDTWQQYTGLKDKNGVEIYEGDVLAKDDLVASVYWDEDKSSWVMEYVKGNRLGYIRGWAARSEWQPWEVIGNIYENPELAEVQS